MDRKCIVMDCKGKYYCKGVCFKHYMRMRKGFDIYRPTKFDKRPHIIKGEYAYIPIGIEAKDGYAIVDIKNSYLDKYQWSLSLGYPVAKVDGTTSYMHKLILKGGEVDHINNDRKDNRIHNLRVVSRQQNTWNTSKGSRNTSGFKGVSAAKGRWRACLRFNGKNIHIGYFNDKLSAAKAYDLKATELFGEYANINFPLT